MKMKWIWIVLLVGLVGWTVYDFVLNTQIEKSTQNTAIYASGDGELPGLKAGEHAPDFELETIDGEVVKLSDYLGEKVLLNFWATWCPPCRKEMPDMQKYHDNNDEGVILAVNLTDTERNMNSIEDFLTDYGITFNILVDQKSKVTQMYEAHALPTSYFIDTEGIVYKKAIGAINYDLLVEEFTEMK